MSGASLKIVWPLRTRAELDHGLSSAQSAKVVFTAVDANGNDLMVNVNRNSADLTLHTETYPVPTSVQKPVSAMTATFYALPRQAGAVVGTASAQVTLTGKNLDFGSIVVNGTIKAVAVISPPWFSCCRHFGAASGIRIRCQRRDRGRNTRLI